MKKIFILLAILWAVSASAQEKTTYLWPISGAKPGDGIVSKPQSYIDDELNFGSLFITAPEGTTVVSPVDGTITHVSVGYYSSLTNSSSWGYQTNFDQTLPKIRETAGKQGFDPRYIGGDISIQCTDGNKIWISGLTGDQVFKTGQKITRGTPIGRVGYSYRKIKEPSIKVSISRGGQSSDPMTPFGLKTTFIPPAEVKPISSFTKAQVKEDFLIYIGALKECYPGLYDIISPKELDQYVAQTTARIDNHPGDWSYAAASGLFVEAVAKIHDSHINMFGPSWRLTPVKAISQQKVAPGWLGGTLLCRNAAEPYQGLIGRPIKSINGIPADSLKRKFTSTLGGYDANVKSYVDGLLAYNAFGLFFDREKRAFDFDMRLVMADDGQTIDVKGGQPDTKDGGFLPESGKYYMINRHQKGYELKMLNDSTAYIGLSTLGQNQVQMEDIARFIDSIATVPHLIIDVRNNPGGFDKPLEKFYSYIAGEPMVLDGYSKVNKQKGFESFKYSLNRDPQDSSFSHYSPEAGREGFYLRQEKTVRPDPKINYKGKIYVLTNEYSSSAATLLPALLVRNHRGVVVGRETRSAYHFLNALQFANIRLPNTTITIKIPLVHCRFDSVVNDRVPYGRGVIPDYEVPLSFDELSFKNGDAILNRALQLIEQGKYLSKKNPFAHQNRKKSAE